MFEEVQKRQRRQLSGLGLAMVVFGSIVTISGVCGLVFRDAFEVLLSRPMAVRGTLAGLAIVILGVVSIVRSRRQ